MRLRGKWACSRRPALSAFERVEAFAGFVEVGGGVQRMASVHPLIVTKEGGP